MMPCLSCAAAVGYNLKVIFGSYELSDHEVL